jgi:Uma2 family endonuclease
MSETPTTTLRIPGSLPTLAAFRAWARSDRFPERGRIDWIGGEVEVDLSPEELNTHGTLKGAISGDLRTLIEPTDGGVVLIDSTRLSSDRADLSAEPDVLVLLSASLEAGRVRLIPKAGGGAGRYTEVEGGADLVVECVSDSSEEKDFKRLPGRYYRAGVRELWLVDARGAGIDFRLLRRDPADWELTPPDANGFRVSEVLGVAVRLVRIPVRGGLMRYRLETR